MDIDTNSTLTLPSNAFEMPFAAPKNEALSRQQVQILFADVDNLRSMYATYKESQNGVQFSILYRRVNMYLQRMDELACSVVLDAEQLKRFQEDKQYLDKLAFELAGSFSSEKGHHFGMFGHHHGKMEKKWMKHQHKWDKKNHKQTHSYW